MVYEMQTIGTVHSCFREKFGVPRQPGLVPEARATIEILPPFDRDEAFAGLEDFSHIWVIFIFHQTVKETWKATVRPPRLGGNQRVGVFASRSMFRPNPLGLSVVRLEQIHREDGKLLLTISGVDLVDGTPVVDIKPYLPYAENISEATGAYAPEAPASDIKIQFSPEALTQCRKHEQAYPHLQSLIEKLLQLDPRPAYQNQTDSSREYGMRLLDFDVKWVHTEDGITVLSLK